MAKHEGSDELKIDSFEFVNLMNNKCFKLFLHILKVKICSCET